MKQPNVLVVGSINIDLTIYGPPRAAAYGEVLPCVSYRYAAGGKGANQACALSKLGANCVITGCVGNDADGRKALKIIQENGVDCSYVSETEEAQTGLVTLFTKNDGRYYGYSVLGSNLHINEAIVKRALEAKKYDMVVMQLEMPLETAYRTFEMAREQQIPVMLDPGPAMSISLERFKGVALITPNEAETKALTGIEINNDNDAELAIASLYRQANPKYIILKLGARGVYCFDGKEARHVPAYTVQALDTTAAGDTFNAALCISLCNGQDLWRAIDFAQAAAALSVTRKGAIDSIPSLSDVKTFFSQHSQKSLH
jgi:ribokinase